MPLYALSSGRPEFPGNPSGFMNGRTFELARFLPEDGRRWGRLATTDREYQVHRLDSYTALEDDTGLRAEAAYRANS
jgi:hypothetical protein